MAAGVFLSLMTRKIELVMRGVHFVFLSSKLGDASNIDALQRPHFHIVLGTKVVASVMTFAHSKMGVSLRVVHGRLDHRDPVRKKTIGAVSPGSTKVTCTAGHQGMGHVTKGRFLLGLIIEEQFSIVDSQCRGHHQGGAGPEAPTQSVSRPVTRHQTPWREVVAQGPAAVQRVSAGAVQ